MKRTSTMTAWAVVVALVTITWTTPVLAEDCKFHRFRGGFSLMEEPLEGFDACYFSPVRGTLNGELITCYLEADFYPSDFLWGDGNYTYWAGKGYDFLETSEGQILFEERAIFDLTSELAAGQAEITSGTGDYEGATGVLQFYNKYPNRLDLFEYDGRICTPED